MCLGELQIHSRYLYLSYSFVYVFDRYDIPQYGSQRRLITPVYDEYGEVIMEDDGYYYGPRGPEVLPFLKFEFHAFRQCQGVHVMP